MDKDHDVFQYVLDNNILTVERCFVGDQHICELLKQFLLEERRMYNLNTDGRLSDKSDDTAQINQEGEMM